MGRFATGRFPTPAVLVLITVLTGVPGRPQTLLPSPAPAVHDHPYTPEQEQNLGRALLQTMLVNTPAIQAPELDRYLQATTSRLAKQFPQLQFNLQVTVISGRTGGATYEPSTLPGGYIAIPADLILEARREDEFVGMLAHAIAHSAEGHPTQVISSSAGGTASSASGTAEFSTAGASSFPVAMTGIQPSDEPVADALAVQAMATAGYDPEALLDYLQRANNFRRLFAGAEVGDDAASRLDELRQVVDQLRSGSDRQSSKSPVGERPQSKAFLDAQEAVFDALAKKSSGAK